MFSTTFNVYRHIFAGGYFNIVSSRLFYQKFNSSQLSGAYDPVVEDEIQRNWQKIVSIENENKPIFSILLPPPNITGNLHLGHALTITVQDTIVRWRKMRCDEVCWVPGFDHAGLATQAVVERNLAAKFGLTREQMGQDRFMEEIWAWRREKGMKILEQIRALGPLLDWSKEFFTLDKVQKDSVTSALGQLWKSGLIYRDSSVVNWCCKLGSVLSDIEVTSMNTSGPTPFQVPGQEFPVIFGRMFRFAYPLKEQKGEVVVATTRPETILGDVAVAVHPSDQRYAHLHDTYLLHPLTGESIPLIFDDEVDPTFGTGAVKITPAHDNLDYKIGKKHNLPLKQVINEDGNLSAQCGIYSGMNRWVAREQIINDLAKKSLLRRIDPHIMDVPVCSRSGDIIEPLLKDQWFIKCKQMAERASTCVRNGELKFEPEKYNNTWFNWMDNINDWCISRQVWWGHEIPFYQCFNGADTTWICANDLEEATNKAKELFGSENVCVIKDPDVLDTWFSSALLPFTVHGWKNQTADFRKYYPLSLMVTGNDILFFWVARMVMLGLELTNQLPFKKVLLHGIICDNLGRKMSKSKGNVLDPMNIIQGSSIEHLKAQVIKTHEDGIISENELQTATSCLEDMYPEGIPKCGADSLRFTLLSQKIQNTQVNFDVKECYSNKLFCNKLWQATKFAIHWAEQLGIKQNREPMFFYEITKQMDRWILHKLSLMVDCLNKSLERNEFHLATAALRSFLYSDLCSVYIECIKPVLKSDKKTDSKLCCEVLLFSLEVSFRCLAPFMPHLSDKLYGSLPVRKDDSVFNCTMPLNLQFYDFDLNENVQEILNIVEIIRRLKYEIGATGLKSPSVFIITSVGKKLENFIQPIQVLSRCSKVVISAELSSDITKENFIKERINSDTEILVPLKLQHKKGDGLFVESINPKKIKLQNELNKLHKMMLDKGYEKVLPEIKNAHNSKILKLNSKLKQLDQLEEAFTKRK